MQRIIKKGKKDLLILKNATKHYAEKSLFRLLKKLAFGNRAYYEKKGGEKFEYLPKTKKERKELIKTLFFNLTIIPNFIYSIKIFSKKKDPVIFFYPFVVFIDTITHILNYTK